MPARRRRPDRRRSSSPTTACTPRRRAPAHLGRRQAGDALLQALQEREPDLRGHLDDVAELALAVGRELGLDCRRARRRSSRAAELHDVGKVAVPDAILHKPGPLDDVEWSFMRQHTIVGDRILSAAPALEPVAKLVRASHERYDGTRLPGPAGRRRHPAGRAHRRGLRRLPRDDLGPPVPPGDAGPERAARAAPLLRPAVRPGRRRGVLFAGRPGRGSRVRQRGVPARGC